MDNTQLIAWCYKQMQKTSECWDTDSDGYTTGSYSEYGVHWDDIDDCVEKKLVKQIHDSVNDEPPEG